MRTMGSLGRSAAVPVWLRQGVLVITLIVLALIVLGALPTAIAQARVLEKTGTHETSHAPDTSAEDERREWWRSVSGQDPDLVMPEDERRTVLQEVQDLLDLGTAQGVPVSELAAGVEDPKTAARYAVALAGLRLSRERAVFLESLLTGRAVRAFLEMEARRTVTPLRAALAELPPDIWKKLQISWPELSPAQRLSALQRFVSWLAPACGMKQVSLRPYADYRAEGMERSLAFVLPHIDESVRRSLTSDAVQGTDSIFLGPASLNGDTAGEVLAAAVLEEMLHLRQRRARAEFNAGVTPRDKDERIRLMLLSANAVEYYPAAAVRGAYDPARFQRHLLQPIEFETKVVLYVLASRTRFLRRATLHTVNGHDIFE